MPRVPTVRSVGIGVRPGEGRIPVQVVSSTGRAIGQAGQDVLEAISEVRRREEEEQRLVAFNTSQTQLIARLNELVEGSREAPLETMEQDFLREAQRAAADARQPLAEDPRASAAFDAALPRILLTNQLSVRKVRREREEARTRASVLAAEQTMLQSIATAETPDQAQVAVDSFVETVQTSPGLLPDQRENLIQQGTSAARKLQLDRKIQEDPAGMTLLASNPTLFAATFGEEALPFRVQALAQAETLDFTRRRRAELEVERAQDALDEQILASTRAQMEAAKAGEGDFPEIDLAVLDQISGKNEHRYLRLINQAEAENAKIADHDFRERVAARLNAGDPTGALDVIERETFSRSSAVSQQAIDLMRVRVQRRFALAPEERRMSALFTFDNLLGPMAPFFVRGATLDEQSSIQSARDDFEQWMRDNASLPLNEKRSEAMKRLKDLQESLGFRQVSQDVSAEASQKIGQRVEDLTGLLEDLTRIGPTDDGTLDQIAAIERELQLLDSQSRMAKQAGFTHGASAPSFTVPVGEGRDLLDPVDVGVLEDRIPLRLEDPSQQVPLERFLPPALLEQTRR